MNNFAVLILSNSSEQLDRLLTSLFVSEPNLQRDKIFVVESEPNPVLKKKWEINYIKGDKNFNFAKNFNIGITAIPNDLDLFFVSNQGILLSSGGIERLRLDAYSDTSIGMAGASLMSKSADFNHSYQIVGALEKPTKYSELEDTKNDEYNTIFHAVYFKRDVINKITPIPESIFTYGYEDHYLCKRMIELGYDWIINPNVLMTFLPEWDGSNAPTVYYQSRKQKPLDLLNAYYHMEDPENLNSQEIKFCDHIKASLLNAQNGISKITQEVLDIPGMSSPKGRHLLNNLCSMPNVNYLEIGTWKGSTLISALFNNKETMSHAIAIDNWSRCGGPEAEFHENRLKFLSTYPLQFYSEESFSLDVKAKIQIPINIYFYDGDHSALSQERAFTYYDSAFADTFIAIVDDWNWEKVRMGTLNAFEKLQYQILFEIVLPSRWNGDKETWWNGYYLALIRKPSKN